MTNNVWKVLGFVLLALIIGSAGRLASLRGRSEAESIQLRKSLGTWWCLAILMTLAAVCGPAGTIILLCAASLLGLRELVGLMPARHADRHLVAALYIVVVLNYVWILLGWEKAIAVFLPIATLVFVCVAGVVKAETRGILNAVSTLYLGVIITGYLIAHGAALATTLPEDLNPRGGSTGWILFLLLLTAVNDIAQSHWGKRIGRHKITPRVSPNKTWEGMLAGVATTVVVGVFAGSALTPLCDASQASNRLLLHAPYLWCAAAAMIIGVGGFFGDVSMSAIKRDLGVKDSGTMLPGQGGILDRIDSLTFTAPLFYWFIRALYGV